MVGSVQKKGCFRGPIVIAALQHGTKYRQRGPRCKPFLLRCNSLESSLQPTGWPEAPDRAGAAAGAGSCWQRVERDGQLAGGQWVRPPGSAKAFTKLLQHPEPEAVRRFVAS
jgi:hypothetical protein